MSISRYYLIFIPLFSICLSEFSYKDNGLVLALDPFDISNFIINKYYPNQNLDLDYYSLRLDGSTNFPLYQSVPGKVGFDRDTDGTISELKYKQRKTDKYFDTSIFLKKDINIKTDFLLQLETKSIIDNINQNAFFDYRMIDENLILEISYLYHYEDDPDFYSLIEYASKENESFNTGLSITYLKGNLSYKTNFAFQTSYVDRPNKIYKTSNVERFQYNHQTSWFNTVVEYDLTSLFKIFFSNKYKNNLLEEYNESDLLINKYYNYSSSGLSYNIKDIFSLAVGFDNFKNENKANAIIKYSKNNISLQLSADNFIIDEIRYDSGNYSNYNIEVLSRYSSKIKLNYENIMNVLEIGKIFNTNHKYNYFMSNGDMSVWKILFDYNYYNYFNISKSSLSIKSYFNYGISFFPFKDKFKFEMYGKINYFQYEMNSSIDLLSLDLFNYNIVQNNVKLYNIAIGFIFDSFTISYKFKNGLTNETLNNYIEFSEDMNFSHFNYIEIDWLFEEQNE